MFTDRLKEEGVGAAFLDWAVIVGSALLVLLALAELGPQAAPKAAAVATVSIVDAGNAS